MPATLRMWRESCPRSWIPVRGAQIFRLRSIRPRLLSDAEPGEGVEQSKYVEEPHHHANDDDRVQDRFNGTCHWDESVNQPQDDPYDDQGKQYLN